MITYSTEMKAYIVVIFTEVVINAILYPHSICFADEMSIIIGSKFYSLSDDNPCATQLPPNMRYKGEEMIQLCKRNEEKKAIKSFSGPLGNNHDGRPVIWGTTFLEVRLGEDALLRCNVRNLTNGSKVMWYREEDGGPRLLSINNKSYVAYNRTRIIVDYERGTYNLQIINVTRADAGIYSCQIEPELLNIEPKVKVLVPSAILRIETNNSTNPTRVGENSWKQYFTLGQNASLNCVVDGLPKPNITWTRSDKLLHKITINGKLMLPDIQKEDGGTYICDAVNMVNGLFNLDRKHVCVIIN